VLVGYGPAGRRALERLRAAGCARVDVIESNPALAAVALTDGARTHVGDAGRLDVLEHVGIRDADVVAVTTADLDAVRHVTALVRSIAPRTRIVARARYAATVRDMAVAGADRVVDEESLVGERIAAEVGQFLRPGPAG
jgi:voltage-gated potassium channel Kch